MKNIQNIINDIYEFLSEIEDGDKYMNSDPNKEYGLQFDLYQYLKSKGYQVVYELELPNLKQYMDDELNEARVFGFIKGSLRPDLVVNLGYYGYACFELKYNEDDDSQIAEDEAKCRVYVKNCKDVHYAATINLFKCSAEDVDLNPCVDVDYQFSFDACWDRRVRKDGVLKSLDAYPIKPLWAQRSIEIYNGKGIFADYEQNE